MTARATSAQPAPAGGGGPGLLVKVLPYLTVVIAAFAPLAAGIYLLTSLAWSLAERMLFWRSTAAAADPGRPQVPHGGEARAGRRVRKA
jgi:YidC/Oxa1 family membrane protein insertase